MAAAASMFACACQFVAVSSSAQAREIDAESTESQLTAADTLLANVDFDGAIVILERLSKRRAITHEQLIRVTRSLALAHAVVGHDVLARELFVKLLAIDADFKLDTNLSPRVQAPYFEARGFWTAQTVKPGIEIAATVRRNADSRLRITLRDPLHIATRIVVAYRWDTGNYTTKSLPIAVASTVDVQAPPSAARLEMYVRALDGRDVPLFESGAPDNPIIVAIPAAAPGERIEVRSQPFFASPIFWTVAGIVVVGSATAIYVGTREPRSTPATAERLMPTLTCGNQPCQ